MSIEITNVIHAMAIVRVDEFGPRFLVNHGFRDFGSDPAKDSVRLSTGVLQLRLLAPAAFVDGEAFAHAQPWLGFAPVNFFVVPSYDATDPTIVRVSTATSEIAIPPPPNHIINPADLPVSVVVYRCPQKTTS